MLVRSTVEVIAIYPSIEVRDGAYPCQCENVLGELMIGRQLGMAYTMAYTIISDACAGDGDGSEHRSTSGTYEIMDDSFQVSEYQ